MAMPLSARVAPLPGAAAATLRLGPVGEALRDELSRADPALQAFYRGRNYRPIWIVGWNLKPDAGIAVATIRGAAADGLDPAAYGAAELPDLLNRSRSRRAADLARAEFALSGAVGRYLADLHRPIAGAEMIYADTAVAPPVRDTADALAALGRAPSPATAIADLRRMNPLYSELRASLDRTMDPARRRLIRANLERARALPADLGRRYILVDAAAQKLWLYDDGRPVDSMPVVVGKPSEPTPTMAGVVRYAVVRPYWNVPPDLVAKSVAPKVLTNGPGYLATQNMEALSDWSDRARVLPPEEVDWAAVASGDQMLRVRQRPGPHNMMGQVKFVFPNELGVYLHDSPLRQYFGQKRRTESAGCVRLSDAPRLARWLLGEGASELAQAGAPETRIPLTQPIPVYIVYFTAAPEAGGLTLRPDIYGRDPALEARLTADPSRA